VAVSAFPVSCLRSIALSWLLAAAPPDDLAGQEKKLADLDRQIAAKEKELAELKAKAEAVRLAVAKAKGVKVYKSPAELFAGMPKDARPKAGKAGTPERAAATAWMRKNRVGQQVEWVATIAEVVIEERRQAPGTFLVLLSPPRFQTWALGDAFPFGADKCRVRILVRMAEGLYGSYLSFSPVSAATAKTLREFKGKQVAVRGTITDAQFGVNPSADKFLWCSLRVTFVSIGGYVLPLLKKE
jgi:hypothetical protein